MSKVTVKLTGITKSFGTNKVLRGINLDLPAGKITALMGANGAGKSTLVKIICGVYSANSGTITLEDVPFTPSSPSHAIASGVVTVHQSINDGVIPDLDIASNLMLDQLAKPASSFFINARKTRNQARKIAAAIGLEVDVTRTVSDLGLADRQLIAIARAMAHHPKILVLDEPTSSLSASEATRLFTLLDRLRNKGVAILYISHRMSDIRRLADRIVSMRDGEIAGTFETEPLDYEGAVNSMLGQQMAGLQLDTKPAGKPVLVLKDICLKAGAEPFSIDLCEDEVIAITGLVGSGKTDFASVLFGLTPLYSGSMMLNGKPYDPHSAGDAINSGVFLCPKDRASNAVIPGFDITGNITLPFLARHSTASFIKDRSEQTTASATISSLGIVCQSNSDDIGTLSGGNQQKVMVGRWLAETSRLLVLDEPFQGVDIKARRDIGSKIRQTANGRATIVFASEMDEALEIADRIVVMNDHTIVGNHLNKNIDMNAVMAQVAGQQTTQQQSI